MGANPPAGLTGQQRAAPLPTALQATISGEGAFRDAFVLPVFCSWQDQARVHKPSSAVAVSSILTALHVFQSGSGKSVCSSTGSPGFFVVAINANPPSLRLMEFTPIIRLLFLET